IYAFIFGMLVGFINHIYGSLFPSVIIHLMINIAGLYAEMPLTDALGQNVMGIFSLILVILGGAIVYFMVKKNRNRLKPHFMTCLMVFCAFFASAVSCRIVSVNAADQTGNHIKLSVTDPGYDVSRPVDGVHFDYRYGPSMMLKSDGSIDAYFSAPADGKMEYDWISYRHSDDNGKTWSADKMVLSSDPGTMDSLSVCDPDVFYHDGYYYIGYTSTLDHVNKGLANSVFLARSKNPDGPFEKWDGSGFGGKPYPIVYYDGVWLGWGTGEPSFVVLDDVLYLYTTMDTYTGDYVRVRTTEVRTADLSDPLWPGKLEYRGVAVTRTDNGGKGGYEYKDCDSWDVVYSEEYGKFIAVCCNRRFNDDSCILYFESDDGISFERVSELNENVICGCHNCGIMGDENAHIKKGDSCLIGYAYQGSGEPKWGMWATRFAPLSLQGTSEIDRSEEEKENLKQKLLYIRKGGNPGYVFFGADSLTAIGRKGDARIPIEYCLYDTAFNKHSINAALVSVSGYDENIIRAEGGRVTPVSEGLTYADISYEGFARKICFVVAGDEDYEKIINKPVMTDFFSPVTEYELSKDGYYLAAVRPLAMYSDNTLMEISCVTQSNPEFTLSSSNSHICKVRPDGVLIPVSEGSADIKVKSNTGKSYTVRVNVR
ncbi:MAG: hypothetical protein K6G22_10685, partial [Lachnospiraceae bacterium]|nr:hypothetical protein [Lachnospiraceae bacterium]